MVHIICSTKCKQGAQVKGKIQGKVQLGTATNISWLPVVFSNSGTTHPYRFRSRCSSQSRLEQKLLLPVCTKE